MMYAYLVLQLCLFGLSLFGYFQVKKFLSAHTVISDPSHLNDFKSLVRTNMYGALLYLVLGIPTVLISVYLGYTYGLMGIGAVLALSIPQLLFGQHLRTLEEKARQLNCATELNNEFKTIGEVWFKKALPNF